jgi:hypothetical protein
MADISSKWDTYKRGTPLKARDLTEALEILTHEVQGQLESAGQIAFFIGDGLQRTLTDSLFALFTLESWSPSHLFRVAADAVSQSARLARLVLPGEAQIAWHELKNKVEVFSLVKNLASILDLPKDKFISLPDLVKKAYDIAPYGALWAVEGVGHFYAENYWTRHGQPQSLLSEANAPVPRKSLLMLHAGIGLCFADRLFGELTTESTSEEVRVALQRFLVICKDNSRPGYLGATIESLGIVTRDFYPDLFPVVAEQFRAIAPEHTGFFWHGVGRALYFSRQFFLPFVLSVWSDVNLEAITEAERLNAIAGLSWAFTLVNMRQPAIIEKALRRYAQDSPFAEAFSNGVCSSIIVRSDTTPAEPFVAAFYQYQPPSRENDIATTWERRVSIPAQTGVNSYFPVLSQHSAMDQVFRYQDLAQLTARLHNRLLSH